MKKLLAVTLAAALAAGFAGCGGSGNSSGTTGNAASTASGSADAGETIKVGSLAPLTGSVSVYGISTTNGIKMAVDEINANGGVMGRQIELLTEDEKGEVQDAVNGYNKLISDGMVFLIGDAVRRCSENRGRRRYADAHSDRYSPFDYPEWGQYFSHLLPGPIPGADYGAVCS